MNKPFKWALHINFFVYAILLNSVGIVILKSINNYGVSEVQASTLELFKDMPVAIVSFLIASFVPRIGYKKIMVIALSITSMGLIQMWAGNSFVSSQILFAIVGSSFALIKVAVYGSIGEVTSGEKEHNALMSSVEGTFMFGIALAYFLFPAFNSETDPSAWLNVYLLLTGLVLVAVAFLARIPELPKEENSKPLSEEFSAMLGLIAKLLVVVFVFSAFLYVMVEQGIMTWLPTFNEKVLALSESNSIRMASILAITLGLGRILGGRLSERFHWTLVISGSIIGAMLMVAFVLPQALDHEISEDATMIFGLPVLAFIFPLVGLFIAPIYPLLNSVVLSALPKKMHSPMTGLIVLFSATGGTLGSRITAYFFERLGGGAFYFTLAPMTLLLIAVFVLRRLTKKA
ncbi:MAG: MFS transporter [Schleiferiaceae bacterium]|nr:MFS transporter [Schleiferiaceae bacterium]